MGGVELFSALELSQVRDREQVLGLLIVPLFLDNVLEFTPVDKRAASLRRPGEQGVLLVVCTYAPNSSAEYLPILESLEQVLVSAPPRDPIILSGDLSTHVGNENETWWVVIGWNSLPDLNLSGVQLLNFCASHSFFLHN